MEEAVPIEIRNGNGFPDRPRTLTEFFPDLKNGCFPQVFFFMVTQGVLLEEELGKKMRQSPSMFLPQGVKRVVDFLEQLTDDPWQAASPRYYPYNKVTRPPLPVNPNGQKLVEEVEIYFQQEHKPKEIGYEALVRVSTQRESYTLRPNGQRIGFLDGLNFEEATEEMSRHRMPMDEIVLCRENYHQGIPWLEIASGSASLRMEFVGKGQIRLVFSVIAIGFDYHKRDSNTLAVDRLVEVGKYPTESAKVTGERTLSVERQYPLASLEKFAEEPKAGNDKIDKWVMKLALTLSRCTHPIQR